MTAVINLPDRLEHWPRARLKRFDRNPRTHSKSQIAKIVASLQEFGWTNPILVDVTTEEIIAGHGRLAGAEALGIDPVPVIPLSHLSDAQRRAYVIADNRLALDAGWDEDLLGELLAELDDDGFDITLTGFDVDELDDLLPDDDDGALVDADPEAVPEVQAVPTSRLGDIWLLGRHRVKCGDSTNIGSMQALVEEQAVDCLWTDPPYNVNYESKAGKIANDHMSDDAFAVFLRDLFAVAFAVMRPGAPVYVAHADTEGLNFRREFLDAGFHLSGCLVWVKPALVLGRSDYQWRHEPILYGWKPGFAHSWYGGRDKTTVIEEAKPARNADHPTMKPVALIRRMLENSTKRGDVVLDICGGSGSTLIACEELSRQARIMELDGRFVDVIVRRWQELTGRQAILQVTGQSFADIEAERRVSVAGGSNMVRVGIMVAGRPFDAAANDDGSAADVA